MNKSGEKPSPAQRLEAASAAKLRGLPVPREWADIEKEARQLAVETGALGFAARVQSRELASAARALEAVAQGAPEGGAAAKTRGLWAAAAYAAGGNFPCANVVMARTFPRRRATGEATATLLCALCPNLRFDLRAQTPLASALDALFEGAPSEALKVWDSIANAEYAPELWNLARAGLDAVCQSATRIALAGATLPDGFVARLSAHIPTLLPPQLAAIEGGLLGGDNALAALPPGTGKTLLGELFLAAALGREPGLAVFVVPYVSLGRGVVAALRAHCPPEIPVHRWLGGRGDDGESCQAHERAEIAVVTPERFDALLRARPEIWAQLRGVVIDEAHTLGDGARGVRVEGLITRVRAHQLARPAAIARAAMAPSVSEEPGAADEPTSVAAELPGAISSPGAVTALTSVTAELPGATNPPSVVTAPTSVAAEPPGATAFKMGERKDGGPRLMLLSAALDESEKLREWAGIALVFVSSWTPTARRLAFWRADGRLEWHAELSGGRSRALGESSLNWPHPINEGGDGWARVRRLESSAWANVAYLARRLHEERGGAILCLCATRRDPARHARSRARAGRTLGDKHRRWRRRRALYREHRGAPSHVFAAGAFARMRRGVA